MSRILIQKAWGKPDILHFLQVPLLILLIFLENYHSRLSTGQVILGERSRTRPWDVWGLTDRSFVWSISNKWIKYQEKSQVMESHKRVKCVDLILKAVGRSH